MFSRGLRAGLCVALTAVGLVALSDTASADTADTAAAPGSFVSTAPTRILDTRLNHGGSVVGSGKTLSLQVLDNGPIPASGVKAVVLNVTVTAPTQAGYITVWADGTSRPTASNLNFSRGETVPNLVIAPVGANGKVDFFNSYGTTQLVADVSGYFVSGAPTAAGAFATTTPTRLLDTRKSVGGTVVGSGQTLTLKVGGRGPVPASGVSAVVLNVTATQPSTGGYVTVWGSGTKPTASNLNFLKGQTVPNLVVTPVDPRTGTVKFFNNAGSTQLIADVAGYYLGATPSATGTFKSTSPTRLLDTRRNLGGTLVGRGGTLSLQVSGATAALPATGISAVVLNVTVAQPASGGVITVWADGTDRPTASNLNFVKGETVANLVVAPVGADGKVDFYNTAVSTHLIADVAGYYLADTTPPAPVTAPSAVAGSRSVALSWTNPLDDDFAGVVIRRAPGSDAPASLTDGVAVGTTVGATTSLTDTTVSPSSPYSYSFFAFDEMNNYAPAASLLTVLTTAQDTTPPGPVTNLAATPTANTVAFTWSNPIDPDFAGVMIRRVPGSAAPVLVTDGVEVTRTEDTVTTFTDRSADLEPSQEYSYGFFAFDGSENFAAPVGVDVTTLPTDTTPPGPVTGLTATVAGTSVSLKWTNPSDDDFAKVIVSRAPASAPTSATQIAVLNTPKSAFTDVALVAGTTYNFSVTAYDSTGNAAGAAVATAKPVASTGPGPVLATSNVNVTADALPTTQIDGVAWSQVIVDNTVYVGGSFANARPAGFPVGTNQTARANMLAYDLTTGELIPSFAPVFNGQIRTMAVSPDKTRLYVGGDFTTVNGAEHDRIAAFSLPSGALVTLFKAGADATVRAIVATNSTVYAGGTFSTANGVVRSRLAAFQAGAGVLTGWAPVADNAVDALLISPVNNGSTMVVGGAFANLNSTSARGIGAVSSATGASVAWLTSKTVYAYGSGSAFLSLATDGTSIFGTAYNFRGTGNIEGAFSANAATGAINWVEDCHGDTYSIFPMNGTVYTVSHAHYCGNVGGWTEKPARTYHRTVAFTSKVTGVLGKDTTGYANHAGLPAPSIVDWFPDLAAGSYTGQRQAAWSVTGNGQYLVEGGEFPTVNGVAQQGLVRFAVPSVLPATVAPGQSGPMITGSHFVPKVVATASTSITLSIPSNWDRDDLTLYYKLVRDGDTTHPVWTGSSDSEPWNLPSLGPVVESGLTPDTTYRYRLYVSDADGNTVVGDSLWVPTSP